MHLGVLEVLKNLRVTFGFFPGWFLYLPAVFRFPPTCWDVKKIWIFKCLIKLYNASGTSCLISYRKYRKQCIPWLGTHTDVMRSIHYMCCGSIIYPWFKYYFTLFEIHYNTLQHPKAKEYKSKTNNKMNHNIKLSWYYANIISINHFSLLVFFS